MALRSIAPRLGKSASSAAVQKVQVVELVGGVAVLCGRYVSVGSRAVVGDATVDRRTLPGYAHGSYMEVRQVSLVAESCFGDLFLCISDGSQAHADGITQAVLGFL